MKLILRVNDHHLVNLIAYTHLRALTVERVTGIFGTPHGLEPGVQDTLLFICKLDYQGATVIDRIYGMLANPANFIADLRPFARPAGPGEINLLVHAANGFPAPKNADLIQPFADEPSDPQPYESEP